MWPFRRPVAPGALASHYLDRIPPHFMDDGCSWSPDTLWLYDLHWACRIHDWFWCTRAHGSWMQDRVQTQHWKRLGDRILRRVISDALPSPLKWVADLYWNAVSRFSSSFNTCGETPRGASLDQCLLNLCRHDMPKPDWMNLNPTSGGNAA